MSVVVWIIWFWGFKEDPASIESISLILAGFAFNGLLFLHLWIKYVILPWRKRQGKED
ncbi:hypothetical protein VCAG7404_002602 [Vibrio cholerae O1 str. AG-7404]|nr:hypothetical protein VCAG7404_002602 [Vibrio cholerae O1 str. AG-7404]